MFLSGGTCSLNLHLTEWLDQPECTTTATGATLVHIHTTALLTPRGLSYRSDWWSRSRQTLRARRSLTRLTRLTFRLKSSNLVLHGNHPHHPCSPTLPLFCTFMACRFSFLIRILCFLCAYGHCLDSGERWIFVQPQGSIRIMPTVQQASSRPWRACLHSVVHPLWFCSSRSSCLQRAVCVTSRSVQCFLCRMQSFLSCCPLPACSGKSHTSVRLFSTPFFKIFGELCDVLHSPYSLLNLS